MRSTRLSPYDSDPPHKSLTPQRKHRKLLKDGSSEVWPEDIERIFVHGLREYWDSPWATFSRGRSRWRNQFLVDYLQRHGVDRSKKQVASHIQVLRNMWKGEAEYKLVAGGDELYLDTNIKSEDQPDGHLLTPSVCDDHSPPSDRSGGSAASICPSHSVYSASSPPVCSTTELTISHFAATRVSTTDDDARPFRSFSPPDHPRAGDVRRPSPLATSCWSPQVSPHTAVQLCSSAELYTSPDTLDNPVQFPPALLQQLGLVNPPPLFTESSSLLAADRPLNLVRLTQLSLWAEGMPSCTVPVDTLVLSTQPSTPSASSVALSLKLHLPPIDAPCAPGLHGFQASVTCTSEPSSTFRCSTSVLVRNQCVSQEIEYCSPVNVESSELGMLETTTLLLPDSALSRSRWLDFTSPTRIIQKLFINDELLAVFFYDLDRGQCENMPFVELNGVKKYLARVEKPPSPLATYHADSQLPTYTHAHGQCIPRASLPAQTSLSYALSPVNTNTTSRSMAPYVSTYMTPSLLS